MKGRAGGLRRAIAWPASMLARVPSPVEVVQNRLARRLPDERWSLLLRCDMGIPLPCGGRVVEVKRVRK